MSRWRTGLVVLALTLVAPQVAVAGVPTPTTPVPTVLTTTTDSEGTVTTNDTTAATPTETQAESTPTETETETPVDVAPADTQTPSSTGSSAGSDSTTTTDNSFNSYAERSYSSPSSSDSSQTKTSGSSYRITIGKVKLLSNGRLSVNLRCLTSQLTVCRAKLRITVRGSVIGQGGFKIVSGRDVSVSVALSDDGEKYLRKTTNPRVLVNLVSSVNASAASVVKRTVQVLAKR